MVLPLGAWYRFWGENEQVPAFGRCVMQRGIVLGIVLMWKIGALGPQPGRCVVWCGVCSRARRGSHTPTYRWRPARSPRSTLAAVRRRAEPSTGSLALGASHWEPRIGSLVSGACKLEAYCWEPSAGSLALKASYWQPRIGDLVLGALYWGPRTGNLVPAAWYSTCRPHKLQL